MKRIELQPERVEEPGGFGLLDLAILWRRKWFLVLAVVGSVALGAAYVAITPEIYEAEARMMVQKTGSLFDITGSDRRHGEFLANQVEIIRSPLTVLGALDKIDVHVPEGSDVDPVSFVLENLRVSPMLATDVLKIGYRTEYPDEAVPLIEAIIAAYEDHLRETKQDTFSGTLELLSQRDEELRKELATLQEEYRQVRAESPVVGTGEDSFSVHMTLVKHLSDKLAKTRGRRIDLENALDPLDQVVRRKEGFDAQGLAQLLLMLREEIGADTRDIAEMQREIWTAEIEVKEMSQTFGEGYPQLVATRKKIDWWEELLTERLGSVAVVLRKELEVVKATEANLELLYSEEVAKMKEVDDYLLREDLLLGNIRRVIETHDAMLGRLAEFRLAEQELAGGNASIRVQLLDGPKLEPSPVWPQPIQLLGLCGVIGLALGVAMVVVVDLAPAWRRPAPEPAPEPFPRDRHLGAGDEEPRHLPMVRSKRRH